MIRPFDKLRAHHERLRLNTVRPELVEGQVFLCNFDQGQVDRPPVLLGIELPIEVDGCAGIEVSLNRGEFND